MQITYTPDTHHWRWVLRVTYQTRTLVLRTLGLTLLASAAFAFASRITGWPLAVAGICLLLLPELLTWISLKRLPEKLAFCERRIALSADGVEVSTPHMRCFYSLEIISDVVQTKNGWLVLVESQPCTMIPRDAVQAAHREGVAEFVDLCRTKTSDPTVPRLKS